MSVEPTPPAETAIEPSELRKGKLAAEARTTGRPRTRGVTDYLVYVVVAVLIAVPIVVIAAVIIPAYKDKQVQARVREVLAAAQDPKAKISEYFGVHGRLPDRPGEVELGKIGKPRDLGEVRIEPGGRIRLELTGPHLYATPNLEGKSIVLAPVIEAGKITEWRCSSDIPDGYLPASCRKKARARPKT